MIEIRVDYLFFINPRKVLSNLNHTIFIHKPKFFNSKKYYVTIRVSNSYRSFCNPPKQLIRKLIKLHKQRSKIQLVVSKYNYRTSTNIYLYQKDSIQQYNELSKQIENLIYQILKYEVGYIAPGPQIMGGYT